jgi:SOS response regulatory protein OraA/RecX
LSSPLRALANEYGTERLRSALKMIGCEEMISANLEQIAKASRALEANRKLREKKHFEDLEKLFRPKRKKG